MITKLNDGLAFFLTQAGMKVGDGPLVNFDDLLAGPLDEGTSEEDEATILERIDRTLEAALAID